jgi:hypothetical protein
MSTYLNRFEKKFIISQKQYVNLYKSFNKIFQKDNFSKINKGYFCLSIYFDDNNLSFIKSKEEGLYYRKKIRLRAYLENLNETPSFWNLEIKIKENNIVRKRKIKFSNFEIEKILRYKKFNKISNSFPETFNYQLYPKFVTFYYREALNSKILPHCRLTFDKYIQCFNYHYNFYNYLRKYNNYIIDIRLTLLELKYSNYLPNFISHVLRSENLNQITFSKYVDGFEKLNSKY